MIRCISGARAARRPRTAGSAPGSGRRCPPSARPSGPDRGHVHLVGASPAGRRRSARPRRRRTRPAARTHPRSARRRRSSGGATCASSGRRRRAPATSTDHLGAHRAAQPCGPSPSCGRPRHRRVQHRRDAANDCVPRARRRPAGTRPSPAPAGRRSSVGSSSSRTRSRTSSDPDTASTTTAPMPHGDSRTTVAPSSPGASGPAPTVRATPGSVAHATAATTWATVSPTEQRDRRQRHRVALRGDGDGRRGGDGELDLSGRLGATTPAGRPPRPRSRRAHPAARGVEHHTEPVRSGVTHGDHRADQAQHRAHEDRHPAARGRRRRNEAREDPHQPRDGDRRAEGPEQGRRPRGAGLDGRRGLVERPLTQVEQVRATDRVTVSGHRRPGHRVGTVLVQRRHTRRGPWWPAPSR